MTLDYYCKNTHLAMDFFANESPENQTFWLSIIKSLTEELEYL